MPEQKAYIPPKLRSAASHKHVSLTLKREPLSKEQMFAKQAKENAGKADSAWDD